ncbi:MULTISPECIES: dTDP-4-dehydrorhamnose reductase [unclassified Streptomyces]|uniref:dTDP-4-dehydrorhamnose reductase n=1 Tax=unclassified Streptomyces TaxID=2593676 RepID=UPI0011C8A8AF|nr:MULTISPECIES: dTDP-4-dehydrorhamnose reductase [unclassified Streptomyces]WSQ79942.1 dTDP-4-dehydrorhamnose reductase [Streptomyces sp. NBC_01213]TXS08915.1 dTDP-4-dehydrorhamnose reductase [Streptomyces sp. wa22]WSQ87323.1 dTDP-4-dehydrorhamnose reductase [Streptomyces sp. NBC_01212]WSR06662.1 dTDP-4-dehydrorhamnose reductase [Streptomyces sp. NBC_01208]WSR50601.1 dTDP-4-dehydrorhamnose reductase [Streptomyces sp. NBC_01201]
MSAVWLVTGAGGMLGQDVLARLAVDGVTAVAAGRDTVDIADEAAVRAAFEEHRPAVVVNCAAWTAVDDAETDEEAALRVNARGPAVLARACQEYGAVLLQVSTDYVFAGDAARPYPEDAPTGPRSAYGRTKLAGEQAVLDALPDSGYIVRTAWLYGAAGGNFVRTMIKLERVKDTLDVVDDQRGQPTWTVDLADRLVRLGQGALAGTAPAGVYHGTSGGETTWFGLTREIFRLLDTDPERVRPTTSEAFVRPAPRPAYSVLGHDRWKEAGIEPLRDWRSALGEAFPALLAAERS